MKSKILDKHKNSHAAMIFNWLRTKNELIKCLKFKSDNSILKRVIASWM